MEARRESGNARITSLIAWSAGISLGLIGYTAIRWGIAGNLNPIVDDAPLTIAGHHGTVGLTIIATMMAGICVLGALAYRLANAQARLDDLGILSWPVFERHISNLFRCRGYAPQKVEPDGRDNLIDLSLCKNGTLTLVQCAQWRARPIDVDAVRALYELLPCRNATAAKFIALGDFTRAARLFAQNKPIELIDGETLLAMLRKAPSTEIAE